MVIGFFRQESHRVDESHRMNEINQLTRQFWVTKEQVTANKYDLSASRYRQVEQEEVFFENTAVTLDRMRQLESFATEQVSALEEI